MSVNGVATDSVMREESAVSSPNTGGAGGGVDYSQTNIQVQGVDESDIIKTDGNYIYYYNSSDNYVYIVSITDKKVAKKIKIPDTFYSPVLYL
jgi:uncharacterized secreted protein with C-terminal beta-propeller domain